MKSSRSENQNATEQTQHIPAFTSTAGDYYTEVFDQAAPPATPTATYEPANTLPESTDSTVLHPELAYIAPQTRSNPSSFQTTQKDTASGIEVESDTEHGDTTSANRGKIWNAVYKLFSRIYRGLQAFFSTIKNMFCGCTTSEDENNFVLPKPATDPTLETTVGSRTPSQVVATTTSQIQSSQQTTSSCTVTDTDDVPESSTSFVNVSPASTGHMSEARCSRNC